MSINVTKSCFHQWAMVLAVAGLFTLSGCVGTKDHRTSGGEHEVDWTLAKEKTTEEEIDWTLAKDDSKKDEVDWTLAKGEPEEEEVDWTLA
jgi:hypothetical protein